MVTVNVREVRWSHPRGRNLELDDGRNLIIQFGNEQRGWLAFSSGLVFGSTPLEAMAAALGVELAHVPGWMTTLSRELEQEHAALEAGPHYVCECCGFRTLLSEGNYDICPVCRWEDDRADGRPHGIDTCSAPNQLTLREARANFKAFGACDERGQLHARPPRQHERQPADRAPADPAHPAGRRSTGRP